MVRAVGTRRCLYDRFEPGTLPGILNTWGGGSDPLGGSLHGGIVSWRSWLFWVAATGSNPVTISFNPF